MALRRINMELRSLESDPIEGISAGPISNDILKWRASIIGPENSPYQGGIFNLKITFPQDYPFRPPICIFETKIYHCNIRDDGGICLDILKDNWSPALTITKVLLSLSSLLNDPNPNDPLKPDIAQLYIQNRKQHDINAKQWTLKYAQ